MDRQIGCPLLVLWGEKGLIDRHYDVLATWRERATEVRGRKLDCGHFLPEEKPEETLDELQAFFARMTDARRPRTSPPAGAPKQSPFASTAPRADAAWP